MKAPIYQRSDMFMVVIEAAVMRLDEPLESINYDKGFFFATDGRRNLVFRCTYENYSTPEGVACPGSGYWHATVCGDSHANDYGDQSLLRTKGERIKGFLERLFRPG